MKGNDGKGANARKSRAVPVAVMFLVLCGFSFYLGGIYCPEKTKLSTKVTSDSPARLVELRKETTVAPLQIKAIAFPECGIDFQDYTPCTDPKVPKNYIHLDIKIMCISMHVNLWFR